MYGVQIANETTKLAMPNHSKSDLIYFVLVHPLQAYGQRWANYMIQCDSITNYCKKVIEITFDNLAKLQISRAGIDTH